MRKFVFIAASSLIIIFIVIFFIVSSLRQNPTPTPSPLPSVTPVPSVPFVTLPAKNDISVFEKSDLISQLPIETNTYNIEYLVESDTFVVTIKDSPYVQNKAAADEFFTRNGVTDLSKLRIIYNSYKWVQ